MRRSDREEDLYSVLGLESGTTAAEIRACVQSERERLDLLKKIPKRRTEAEGRGAKLEECERVLLDSTLRDAYDRANSDGLSPVISEHFIAPSAPDLQQKQNKRYCGSCGSTLDPKNRFCEECGNSIERCAGDVSESQSTKVAGDDVRPTSPPASANRIPDDCQEAEVAETFRSERAKVIVACCLSSIFVLVLLAWIAFSR